MKPDRIWCGRSCQRAAGSMRAVMAASCQKKTKTPKTDSWHTAAPRGRRERRGSPWRGDCGIARPDQSTCSWRVVGTRYSRGTWLRRQPRERGAAQDLVIFWLFLDIWFLAFLPNAECEAPRRQSAAPHDAGRATRDAASAASSSSLHCASPASAAGVPNGVGVVSERCRRGRSFGYFWLFGFGIFAKRRVRLPGGRAPPPTTLGQATRDTANAAASLHCARPSAAVPNGVGVVSERWCRRGVGAHTVKNKQAPEHREGSASEDTH
jgi:hypothetical protein